MKTLRKEDLSLHRYIKDFALREFIEKEELATLELVPDISCEGSYVYQADISQFCEYGHQHNVYPVPTDNGRGWLFFDCPNLDVDGYCDYTTLNKFVLVSGTDSSGEVCIGTPEQTKRVVLYADDLTVISGTDYLIDYIDGRVIFDNDNIVPKYIDYHWNYVSVVDEWPSRNAPEAPVVVIDIDKTNKDGYQLGAGRHIKRKAYLHIFAANAGERSELVETLYDSLYLKCAQVFDFPTGDVLDADGTFYGRKNNYNKLTSLFNRTTLNDLGTIHGSMTFHNVEAKNVKTTLFFEGYQGALQASSLDAYRSTISFEIQTYTRK